VVDRVLLTRTSTMLTWSTMPVLIQRMNYSARTRSLDWSYFQTHLGGFHSLQHWIGPVRVSAVADDNEFGTGPLRRGFEVTLRIVNFVKEPNASVRLPLRLLDARSMEATFCESAVH